MDNIKTDVIKSFIIQDTLNSNIWENGKLKVEILKKLRKIGKDFFNDLDLEPNVKLHDITLTGSISNYNWSKSLSSSTSLKSNLKIIIGQNFQM